MALSSSLSLVLLWSRSSSLTLYGCGKIAKKETETAVFNGVLRRLRLCRPLRLTRPRPWISYRHRREERPPRRLQTPAMLWLMWALIFIDFIQVSGRSSAQAIPQPPPLSRLASPALISQVLFGRACLLPSLTTFKVVFSLSLPFTTSENAFFLAQLPNACHDVLKSGAEHPSSPLQSLFLSRAFFLLQHRV